MQLPARVAVFASGGGSNLQALIDRCRQPGAPAVVSLVVGSRPGIGALERAQREGIAAEIIDARAPDGDPGGRMLALLDAHAIDLVVLAGYLSLIPAEVVERFRGRMLNIHPALLPAFGGPGMYGLHVHRAVIDSGARVSGATVHLVDDRYDEGRILAQWPVPVFSDDSPDALAARVLAVEHRLLPATVLAVASGGGVPSDPAGSFALMDRDGPSAGELAALFADFDSINR